MIFRIIATVALLLFLGRKRHDVKQPLFQPLMKEENNPRRISIGDPEFRILSNDISEELSKNWRFKLQVVGTVVISLIVIAAAIGGMIGWSLSSNLKEQRDEFQRQAFKEISEAKKAVEGEIKAQLRTDNVQVIIKAVAADQAKALIKESLQPSIASFQTKIDLSSRELEKKIARTTKVADNNVHRLDEQLKILTTRNEIASLADKAIGDCDVSSYRKLEDLAMNSKDDLQRKVAYKELYSVFQAFSGFAPTRINGITINVSYLNPKKKTEDELSVKDIISKWKEITEPLGRAKLASLIEKKSKTGSYTTAKFLIEAMKTESNLEAFRYLGDAFEKVSGRYGGGKLDKRQHIQWWEENEEDFKKKDTDPKPTPSSTPSKPPATL